MTDKEKLLLILKIQLAGLRLLQAGYNFKFVLKEGEEHEDET